MATSKAKLTAVPSSKAPAAKPSTAVTVKKTGSNVVDIQAMLKAQVAAMGERTAPASGISIRVTQDKQFMLPDGTKTPGPLDLVIVDFAARNEFYEGAFDPKAIAPPVCFAIGSNPLKLIPSDNSPVRQADDCTSCPMAAWGSDGAGKACKNTRVLAVLPPDADADTPMWLLKVSPTALKGFDGFVNSVARTFQMPPVGVVTKVAFDDNVTYAKLVFSDPTPNENLAEHFARQEEAKALLSTEPDVSGYQAEKPAAKAPAKRAVAGRR